MMWHHLLAAFLSISGVYASFKLLKPSDWSNQNQIEKKVLANLVKSKNDVRKKSLNKLIWEPIGQGDELCNGEMLKTAEDSSASIKFLKNGTTMDLEPNSLVVIEEMKEDVSLGVLEGGLFVSSVEKGKGQEQGKIQLKSGKNAVDLSSGGELSFSVNKSGEANVQVHSGQVEASVGGKAVTLSGDDVGTLSEKGIEKTQQLFLEVRPTMGEVVYLSLQSNAVAHFRFKPLPPGYNVHLELGLDRQRMIPIEGKNSIVSGESGELSVLMRSGLFYWRLVASTKGGGGGGTETFYSMINKNQFQVKQPPLPLLPDKNEKIYLTKGEMLEFKWSLPTPAEQITLELFSDPGVKKLVYQQTIEQGFSHATNAITSSGLYYWRLSAILKGSMETVVSDVFSFELNFGVSLKPPKLISPEDRFVKMLGTEKATDMQLTWQRENMSGQFRVMLKRINGGTPLQVDKITSDPQFLFKGLSEGEYEWSVSTLAPDNNKRASEWAQKRTFSIQNLSYFKWIDIKNRYYFINRFPEIILKWERSSERIVSWQLKISQQKDLSLAMTTESKENSWSFTPQSEGTYFIEATALGEDRNSLAKSPIVSFDVVKSSLPKAPRYSEKMENPLKAQAGGVLNLEFIPTSSKDGEFEDIEFYIVEISTLKGESVQNVKWEKPIGSIGNLMPGQYWAKCKVIDKSGRESGYGESRKVIVPNQSNISAPSLQQIKIKGGST